MADDNDHDDFDDFDDIEYYQFHHVDNVDNVNYVVYNDDIVNNHNHYGISSPSGWSLEACGIGVHRMPESVIFVRGNLESVVWDEKNSRPLAQFVDGLFETSDERVIRDLDKIGYKRLTDYQDGPPRDGFDDPDRGPVIDTRNEDVHPALTETQALMEGQRARLAQEVQNRVHSQVVDDDDLEYVPPPRVKKKNKKASKKKSR